MGFREDLPIAWVNNAGAAALVLAVASLLLLAIGYALLRRENRRLQSKVLHLAAKLDRKIQSEIVFVQSSPSNAELVAQFKVGPGRQTVSILEAGGKRFIHVEGALTDSERASMVRYLKSEGFMS